MSDGVRPDLAGLPGLDPAAHLREALGLLSYAAENSAQLPNDVVAAIAAGGAAVRETGTFGPPETETRFWSAYSLLHSNRLADHARRRYRVWLYVVLAMLLASQIYYLAGSLTVSRLAQVENEWQGRAPATPAPGAASIPSPAPEEDGPATTAERAKWSGLRRFGVSQANYYLGVKMIPFFSTIEVPETLVPAGFTSEKASFMANYMKLRAELELILLSLSGYVLPLLYGTLGAFAYIMRKLSDPIAKLNFASDTWSTFNFRIHIGALGGLAVGWFVNQGMPATGIGSLSPLALAFAAGYGSELLFALLDKVVGAFSTPAELQTTVKSETRGGITIRSETQRQATVAAAPAATPAAAPQPAGKIEPPIRLQAVE